MECGETSERIETGFENRDYLGSVASKGEYTVTLKAKNALGTSTEKLVIRIGDDLLLTPPMGWNSWNTFGRHLTEELVLQTADALVANGMRI